MINLTEKELFKKLQFNLPDFYIRLFNRNEYDKFFILTNNKSFYYLLYFNHDYFKLNKKFSGLTLSQKNYYNFEQLLRTLKTKQK